MSVLRAWSTSAVPQRAYFRSVNEYYAVVEVAAFSDLLVPSSLWLRGKHWVVSVDVA